MKRLLFLPRYYVDFFFSFWREKKQKQIHFPPFSLSLTHTEIFSINIILNKAAQGAETRLACCLVRISSLSSFQNHSGRETQKKQFKTHLHTHRGRDEEKERKRESFFVVSEDVQDHTQRALRQEGSALSLLPQGNCLLSTQKCRCTLCNLT